METMRINRLPAITWNRMDINDISVNLPKLSGAELAIDTNKATISAAPLDVKTGAGERADVIFAGLPVYSVTASAGERLETLVEWKSSGTQGAVLNVTAGEGSTVTLYTHLKSAEEDTTALRLLVNLEKNAKLRLVELLEPGKNGVLVHDLGGTVGENADIAVLHLYLGSGDLYSGCNLRADGTLKDQAEKTFRGTIDFKKGCKGSVGAEQENVLLLGEEIVNKTIPLILCAEEDVQGDHGATIGELDEETLFYFAARGMDSVTAENLLTREKLYRLAEAMGREDVVELARNAIQEVL